jgi:dTDP-4-amino-4,6-dideoxygalactose transaminase
VKRFEEELQRATQAGRVLVLSSGTAALHLGLDLLGVQRGGVVALPTMTFTATAEAALYLGADIRLTDVDALTMNISPATLEPVMSREVRAVIAVDVGGVPHPLPEIREVAASYGADVIADAAHSLGSSRSGSPVGSSEVLAALSFYATKPITTGEGGALTINDPALVARATTLRLHGMSTGAADRYKPDGNWSYDVVERGYKYNLSDLNAALGLAQIGRLAEMQSRRRAIAGRYLEDLDLPELELPIEPSGTETNWHLFVLRLRLDQLSINRDRFLAELKIRGVYGSVHFKPLHLHSFYRERLRVRPLDFPVASSLAERIISLPIYPDMSDDDIDQVCEAVTAICRTHRR